MGRHDCWSEGWDRNSQMGCGVEGRVCRWEQEGTGGLEGQRGQGHEGMEHGWQGGRYDHVEWGGRRGHHMRQGEMNTGLRLAGEVQTTWGMVLYMRRVRKDREGTKRGEREGWKERRVPTRSRSSLIQSLVQCGRGRGRMGFWTRVGGGTRGGGNGRGGEEQGGQGRDGQGVSGGCIWSMFHAFGQVFWGGRERLGWRSGRDGKKKGLTGGFDGLGVGGGLNHRVFVFGTGGWDCWDAITFVGWIEGLSVGRGREWLSGHQRRGLGLEGGHCEQD